MVGRGEGGREGRRWWGGENVVAIGKEVCMGRGEDDSYTEGDVYGEGRRW